MANCLAFANPSVEFGGGMDFVFHEQMYPTGDKASITALLGKGAWIAAAGFYLFSISLAPVIEQRNLQALGAAFVLFIACLPGSSSLGRMTGAALLLTVGYGFSTHGESYLARHQAESNLFYYKPDNNALVQFRVTSAVQE